MDFSNSQDGDLEPQVSFNEAINIIATNILDRLSAIPVQHQPVGKGKATSVAADTDLFSIGESERLNSIQSLLSEDPEEKYIDEDGIKRSGTTLTACAHIITAVIGAGVLALPYSMASMGWILGPFCFLLFAAITLYTAQLLADLYIIDGTRQRTFTDMVYTIYGRWGSIAIGSVQQANLVLTALAYTITAIQSIQALSNSYCDSYDVAPENCFDKGWQWGIIFGALQILLSQVPNLEAFWWASMLGAAMSFGYAFIAFGLVIAYHGTEGSIEPMQMGTTASTVWNILNGVGAVLFAYSFSFILLEIQDTIRTKRGVGTGPIGAMKRAVNISVSIMTCFYVAIAVGGYASLGNSPDSYKGGSILDAYVGIAPQWVIDWANAMVLIHLIPSYQVWSQPHFEFVATSIERSKKATKIFGKGLVFRLWYRTLYVCLVTFLAILLPFFSTILGFVGAIGFWPATVFFPINCWIRVFRPRRTVRYFLRSLDIFCFLVTLAAIAASIESIVVSASSVELFSS